MSFEFNLLLLFYIIKSRERRELAWRRQLVLVGILGANLGRNHSSSQSSRL